MASVSVSRPIAAALVLLAIFLLGLNGFLLSKNAELSARLQAVLAHNFVPAGAALPPLSGVDANGNPIEISPSESAAFVILDFSPECHVCDENWPAWEKLLNDPSIRGSFSFVSSGVEVPKSYLEQHHISSRTTVLGLDPKTARSYNLIATPQTILVAGGTVVRSWPGALNEKDLSEVRSALRKAKDTNP